MSSPVWKCYDVSRNTEKFVVYVLHDDMMNGWFIFNSRFSDVRADLRITALQRVTAPREPELIAAAQSVRVYTSQSAACF